MNAAPLQVPDGHRQTRGKALQRRHARVLGVVLLSLLAAVSIGFFYHQRSIFIRQKTLINQILAQTPVQSLSPPMKMDLLLLRHRVATKNWGPFPLWWVNPAALHAVAIAAQADILQQARQNALTAGKDLLATESPWIKPNARMLAKAVASAKSLAALAKLKDQWHSAAEFWQSTISQLQHVSGGLVDFKPKDVLSIVQQLQRQSTTPTIARAIQAASQYLTWTPARQLAEHQTIMNQLQSALISSENPLAAPWAQYLATRQSIVSIDLYNSATHTTYVLNPGLRFDTASIIKVTIMATLLWDSQRDHMPLSEAAQQLMIPMIEDSSNQAATSLWFMAGGSHGIQAFLDAAGMGQTIPGRNGYWGLTTTSAADQIRLLRLLCYPNAILTSASQAYAANLMTHIVGFEDWGVSGGLPGNVTAALKNGWLPIGSEGWEINSIGHITGAGQNYIVCILSRNNPTEAYGIATIESLSQIIWQSLSHPLS
ncbi:MAG: serine hydrolase [Sulfobacillus sp.]